MSKKVLVLEDETNIRSFIVINLKRAGYETIEAGTGQEALDQLRRNPDVNVALLDVMLPDTDGFEVCRQIRAGNDRIGIIMLTARTQEMDKVTGLMTGADDYVTKPFNPLELTARVKSQLRRFQELNPGAGQEAAGSRLCVRGLEINKDNHQVTVYGEEVKLTPIEFDILYLLASNPGRVFSTDEIFEKVWNEKVYEANNTVMVHIRRLRSKMKEDTRQDKIITTVWGVGYKIEK